jgi:hypothetical protein
MAYLRTDFIEWDKDDIDALGIPEDPITPFGDVDTVGRPLIYSKLHHERRLNLATVHA